MATSCKATCQSLLKQAGLYERVKGSWLYWAYWKVADPSLVERHRQEVEFYRNTLVGLRADGLVFDIGANRGVKSEIFLKLGARVIAVDPDAENQKTLTKRFLALRLRKKPIVIVSKAVSNRSGYETFWISSPGFEMNTLDPRWAAMLQTDSTRFGRSFEYTNKTQVETTTLEEMIAKYGRPFYIKIDVEGHESKVLEGLETAVPYISFEVNLPEFSSDGEQCLARLHEIAAHGAFNCAAGTGELMFVNWMPYDIFTRRFSEIRERSVEVFWRTQTPQSQSAR